MVISTALLHITIVILASITIVSLATGFLFAAKPATAEDAPRIILPDARDRGTIDNPLSRPDSPRISPAIRNSKMLRWITRMASTMVPIQLSLAVFFNNRDAHDTLYVPILIALIGNLLTTTALTEARFQAVKHHLAQASTKMIVLATNRLVDGFAGCIIVIWLTNWHATAPWHVHYFEPPQHASEVWFHIPFQTTVGLYAAYLAVRLMALGLFLAGRELRSLARTPAGRRLLLLP